MNGDAGWVRESYFLDRKRSAQRKMHKVRLRKGVLIAVAELGR